MPPEAPDPVDTGTRQNAALTCYLGAMLAMAKSMQEICSRAGLLYGDRLTRLPRRLAFDATPEELEESRQALEEDLAEYTAATAAWLDAGTGLAQDIVAAIETLEPYIRDSRNLHTAMLEDLARQMSLSAEVDADSEVRASLRLCALSLRSYLQRRRDESGESVIDLQSRAQQLAEWLSRGDRSKSTDLATGLPNREEFERRLKACWHTFTDVSALLFEWKDVGSSPASGPPDAIARRLASRLTDLVRPRDIVGRWSLNQFAVIFGCSGMEAAQRANLIAEELSGPHSAVVDGVVATVCARVTVSVIERLPEETLAGLLLRMEQLQPTELAAFRNA
jgi:GGDEF domain-containing protein